MPQVVSKAAREPGPAMALVSLTLPLDRHTSAGTSQLRLEEMTVLEDKTTRAALVALCKLPAGAVTTPAMAMVAGMSVTGDALSWAQVLIAQRRSAPLRVARN